MVKVLRWWIVWTKADEEDVFEDGNKVVNYPTNLGSISSQILLQWASNNKHLIGADESGLSGRERKVKYALENSDDWRYLQVKTELVERYALEDKHYDKRQTKAQGAQHGRQADCPQGCACRIPACSCSPSAGRLRRRTPAP